MSTLLEQDFPAWLTENVGKVSARRDEIVGKYGEAKYDELFRKADEKDEIRRQEWARYSERLAQLMQGTKGTDQDHLRAMKEAYSEIKLESVRGRVTPKLRELVDAVRAYRHFRQAFEQGYGDPARAKEEFGNRPELGTTLTGIAEEIEDFPRFLERFREGSRAQKGGEEDRASRAIEVASLHTALGSGMTLLREDDATRGILRGFGFDGTEGGKKLVEKRIKEFPEFTEQIVANREGFERYAQAAYLYSQLGAQREDMAKHLVARGEAENLRAGMETVTGWLKAARERLEVIRNGLPTLQRRKRGIGRGKAAEAGLPPTDVVTEPFPLPPAALAPAHGFERFIQGSMRSIGEMYAPVADVMGRGEQFERDVSLFFPRAEQPTHKFGLIPTNFQAFSEAVGTLIGYSPQMIAAAGPTGAVAKGLRHVGPVARGAAAGFTEGAVAEALAPSKTPITDVPGTLGRIGLVGGAGGVLGGVAGLGAKALGRGKAAPKAKAKTKGKATPDDLIAAREGIIPPGRALVPVSKKPPISPITKVGVEAAKKGPAPGPPTKPPLRLRSGKEFTMKDVPLPEAGGKPTPSKKIGVPEEGIPKQFFKKELGRKILRHRLKGRTAPKEIPTPKLKPTSPKEKLLGEIREFQDRIKDMPVEKQSLATKEFMQKAGFRAFGGPGRDVATFKSLWRQARQLELKPKIEPTPAKRRITTKPFPETTGPIKEPGVPTGRPVVLRAKRGQPPPAPESAAVRAALPEVKKTVPAPDIPKTQKPVIPKKVTDVPELPDSPDVRYAAEKMQKRAVRTAKHEANVAAVQADKIAAKLPRLRRRQSLEDAGAVIEGVGNIRIPGDTAAHALGRLYSRHGKERTHQLIRETKGLLEADRRKINEYGRQFMDNETEMIQYVKDYIFHAYHPMDEKKATSVIQKWLKAPKVPSEKHRVIPNLQEAMDMGFTPLTQNPLSLHKVWADLNWRGATARGFIADLQNLKMNDGKKAALPRGEKSPDHVFVQTPVLGKEGVGVHKDVVDLVELMIKRPHSNAAWKVMETINAWTKFINVSFSGFHHQALGESQLAASRDFFFNPLRHFIAFGAKHPVTGKRRLVTSPIVEGKKFRNDPEIAKTLDFMGVGFGHFRPDVGINRVQRQINKVEKIADGVGLGQKVPGLMGKVARVPRKVEAAGLRGINKAIDLNNYVLWDMLHNNWKAYTAMQWRHHMLGRLAKMEAKGKPLINPRTKKPLSIDEVEDEVGKAINDMFGGLEWETQYWASPEMQQWMRRTFFALDWTSANVRVAQQPFSANPVRKEMGRHYWRNMMGTMIAMHGLSQAFIYWKWGDKEKGDTPFFWKNAVGLVKGLEDPRTTTDLTPMLRAFGLWDPKEDKRRVYAVAGKQWREVIRWIEHPFEEAFVKASPIINEGAKLMLHTGVGAWGTKFGGGPLFMEFGPAFAEASKRFRPFAWSDTQFAFTFPKRKGYSYTKGAKLMRDALVAYADPKAYGIVSFTRGDLQKFDKRYEKSFTPLWADIIENMKRNGFKDKEIEAMAKEAFYGSPRVVGAYQKFRGEFYGTYMRAPKNEDGTLKKSSDLKKMETAARKMVLVNRSLKQVKDGFSTRDVKLSREAREEIEKLIRMAESAVGK